MKYKVTILQYRLFHYRMELFERLKNSLANKSIELHLSHGQASEAESVRKDEGCLEWTDKVRNRFWRIAGKELCWQPFPKSLKDSDLVILMQENRILSNYPFLIKHFFGSGKLAFWGHGANLQSYAPSGLRERWKKFWLLQVDWWFAYTKHTVNILTDAGFPENKITCLNNAIDTNRFITDLESVSVERLDEIRYQLGISKDSKVGLFCGSLYAEKKLDLLVQAADLIYQQVPEFVLIVIGDGPSAPQLRKDLESRPWAHCVGVKKGLEKAEYFKLAKVNLNPGAVGLHVLDAFCSGLPMISTKSSLHGPEIVYLEDGVNGFLTSDEPDDYAHTVIKLLTDSQAWDNISKETELASKKYTLDNMVKNFTDGIVESLNIL